MIHEAPRRAPATRHALLYGTAVCALMLAPHRAEAHFQGAGSVQSGTVTGTATSTITIDSPTEIINWSPPDAASSEWTTSIGATTYWNFLPETAAVTFKGTENAGNFAVLNRV
ncbi:MAG: hypothetical protein JWN69_11, partial [Alphaproteobacteria bacterium]|nr:hypothetical protein [Alphaproteobacteria bacterium]